jgi:hypothetical protein
MRSHHSGASRCLPTNRLVFHMIWHLMLIGGERRPHLTVKSLLIAPGGPISPLRACEMPFEIVPPSPFPTDRPETLGPRAWREETPEALPYPILHRLSRPCLATPRLATRRSGGRPSGRGGRRQRRARGAAASGGVRRGGRCEHGVSFSYPLLKSKATKRLFLSAQRKLVVRYLARPS